jgi:hypothetical protein
MFLNILALLSAISISGVAAYYSIAGLTAIFQWRSCAYHYYRWRI